jgi:phage baseplate assembly protein W
MPNPKELLGRGWAFPFQFNAANGAIAYSEYEENIRQNITIIIGTKPGERQMLPEFGCRVHEYLFAPHTRATAAMITQHVRDALRRWEPRIEVLKVESFSETNGAIRVQVEYKILLTDATQTLAYSIGNR